MTPNEQAPGWEYYVAELIKQAKEYGERAARACHKAHDQGMLRTVQQYQRNLEYQNPAHRGMLANAYREAYTEESSYYIGQHCSL